MELKVFYSTKSGIYDDCELSGFIKKDLMISTKKNKNTHIFKGGELSRF